MACSPSLFSIKKEKAAAFAAKQMKVATPAAKLQMHHAAACTLYEL
jgi:hypothetical protein